ncbi:DNA polymerase III subunits gamma and tau [Candidatus Defluviicoccus seviourii]|uniref:DNA polymerase III subunit gamma/tau n=1 Tax=Candidatus Defluviicoccus seviourii TaxID=2565273 RepID=A0A564WHP9_9PROT|nr:DNA polymerase III subunits gamma and tau [Candidatus Defluviicoccus seviourii]
MTTAEPGTSAPFGQTQPYRVLARKYRPQTFAQLIGQEAMVRTLGNALRSGRLAHAYMLSGVRGVGKTTTARIIARALNCIGADGQGGPTPEPCGVCAHCVAIAQDRHLDVIEMDAASRTKVEEIRELLDGVPYRPTSARYKVYIVDEVHMLSTHSFNALLKTLEEPPEHVKFIFATTEIRKVPVTVLSRCQRFDLRRVDTVEIARHLQKVATAEGVSASEGALNLIARAADGSVRDGLSLLDQAIALGEGQIDEAVVRDMLGLVDRTVIFDLFDALMQGEVASALDILSGRYAAGADPAAVLEDLLELTHWITRIKVVPAAAAAPGVAEAERVRGGAMAGKLAMAEVTRVWQILLKGLGETRAAPVPIQAAEMVLIRIAYAARLPTPAEAIESLSQGTGPSLPKPADPPAAQPAAPVSPTSARPVSTPPRGQPRAGDPPPGPVAQVAVRPALGASEAGAAGPAAAGPIALRSFDDVVALVLQHKEVILHGQLVSGVRLVRFADGQIEINLTPQAPADLPQRLSRFLGTETGRRWLVTVSTAPGSPSLYEQQQAAASERRQAVLNHPVIAEIMRVFPGATLEQIRVVSPPADAAPEAIDGEAVDGEALDADADGDNGPSE